MLRMVVLLLMARIMALRLQQMKEKLHLMAFMEKVTLEYSEKVALEYSARVQ